MFVFTHCFVVFDANFRKIRTKYGQNTKEYEQLRIRQLVDFGKLRCGQCELSKILPKISFDAYYLYLQTGFLPDLIEIYIFHMALIHKLLLMFILACLFSKGKVVEMHWQIVFYKNTRLQKLHWKQILYNWWIFKLKRGYHISPFMQFSPSPCGISTQWMSKSKVKYKIINRNTSGSVNAYLIV